MLVSFLRLSEVFRRPYVPLVNLERGLAFSPSPLQRTDGLSLRRSAEESLSKYRRGQLVRGVTEAQVAEPRMIALPDREIHAPDAVCAGIAILSAKRGIAN
jgi:hypothetical protein